MKTGIYIAGLGQSFVDETLDKYAERFMNEMSYVTNGIEYEIKKETVTYATDRKSSLIRICEKNEENKVVYQFYDFEYHEILTEKFNSYSILIKNVWLFLLVLRKFPVIIKRLFSSKGFNHAGETFYLFIFFISMALGALFMLPASMVVVTNAFENESIANMLVFMKEKLRIDDIWWITKENFEPIIQAIFSIIALMVFIVPNASNILTSLATEFVCANDYMQHGVQRQLLQGNLELLVEYISENETDCKIQFHTYSFGSILAIDYLYPFGNNVSKNTANYCEALITIGCPFEFIRSYYPQFYESRKTAIGDKMIWLNIYSIADALASNFRVDAKIGDAEFGVEKNTNKPININYEVAARKKNDIIGFIFMHSIKVHSMYWDNKTEGQSCLRLVYDEMSKRNLM